MKHFVSALLLMTSMAHPIAQTNDAAYYQKIGNQLREQERLEEAIDPFKVALKLEPENIAILLDLGNTYHMLNRNLEALELYKRILEINPHVVSALYNFGFTLKRMGYVEQPLTIYDHLLTMLPEHPATRFSRATLYLTQGDLLKGFEEYEWRWKAYHETAQRFAMPLWNGENLDHKTLLIHAEQGLGDTIQFIRYLAVLKKQWPTSTLIFESQSALVPLLKQQPYIDHLFARGEQPPAAQYQVPLMSIPRIVKTTLETIPANTPYLTHDTELTHQWRARLFDKQKLKVGICWHGNAQYHSATLRRAVIAKSVPLALFEPLAELEEVTLYSLQRVTGLDELSHCSFKDKLILFDETFDQTHGRFMDTAAVMKNLDLVITVDTSTAHLAGALNVRTWVMLPFPADWRWLRNRTDSPWYPSVRLFQQRATREWQPVITNVVSEIRQLIASKTVCTPPHEPTAAQITFFHNLVS